MGCLINPNSRVSCGLTGTGSVPGQSGDQIEPILENKSRTPTGFSTKSAHNNRRNPRPINYGKAQMYDVWEVARAATAAELFFLPMRFSAQEGAERGPITFTDAGFGPTNNPTREGILDMEHLGGIESVNIVVSVGTARKSRPARRHIIDRIRGWVDTMTDTEVVHDQMSRLEKKENLRYFRLNGPETLDVKLDEWLPRKWSSRFTDQAPGQKTFIKIESAWFRWATEVENENYLRKCAKALVQHRRDRVRSEARWERFATCATFACKLCAKGPFDNRDDFRDHLTSVHGHLSTELEKELDRHKEEWQYQERVSLEP